MPQNSRESVWAISAASIPFYRDGITSGYTVDFISLLSLYLYFLVLLNLDKNIDNLTDKLQNINHVDKMTNGRFLPAIIYKCILQLNELLYNEMQRM